jgi:hypothetical protein
MEMVVIGALYGRWEIALREHTKLLPVYSPLSDDRGQ